MRVNKSRFLLVADRFGYDKPYRGTEIKTLKQLLVARVGRAGFWSIRDETGCAKTDIAACRSINVKAGVSRREDLSEAASPVQ